MKVLVLLGACAALVAGCGDADSTSTTPASGELVSFARTGGVASMPVSLEVDEDGSATVVAGVDPARESFDLDDDELEQLRGELEAADLDAVDPSTVPTGCNDCYEYELTYSGTTISYDESEEVPESVTAVVTHLAEIAHAHYPPEASQPPIVN